MYTRTYTSNVQVESPNARFSNASVAFSISEENVFVNRLEGWADRDLKAFLPPSQLVPHTFSSNLENGRETLESNDSQATHSVCIFAQKNKAVLRVITRSVVMARFF